METCLLKRQLMLFLTIGPGAFAFVAVAELAAFVELAWNSERN